MEPQLEIIHQSQAFQLAIEGFQFKAIVLMTGPQFHDRLDLQLKHLHPGDGVAEVAWAEGFQLLGIEQGAHHPVFVAEIVGYPIAAILDRQSQLLTCAESQGHGQLAGRP